MRGARTRLSIPHLPAKGRQTENESVGGRPRTACDGIHRRGLSPLGSSPRTGIAHRRCCLIAIMRYFSVCSGIESASVAWAALAWTAIALAEIESFAFV